MPFTSFFLFFVLPCFSKKNNMLRPQKFATIKSVDILVQTKKDLIINELLLEKFFLKVGFIHLEGESFNFEI